MKSLQLLRTSPKHAFSTHRLRNGFAAVFATAMALGLGASSLMAQGGYYPQIAPLGGGSFEPNGVPVVSSPDLSAVENKLLALYGGAKTLIVPLPTSAPYTGATLAASSVEYAAAVKAVAKDLADGVVVPGVTLGSLAATAANYRTVGLSQVPVALEAIADGVMASASGTKSTQLAAVATAAAAANPGGLSTQILRLFLNKVGSDTVLVADVDALVSAALTGAASTPAGASAINPAGVNLLFANAVLAIPVGNPARKALTEDIATSAVATIVGSPVLNTSLNLDTAAAALTNGVADLNDMIVKIVAAAGAPTDIKAGAIAQGALRNPAYRNAPSYATIISAVGGGTYVTDLVTSAGVLYPTLLAAVPAAAGALVGGGADAAAVAAAAGLRGPTVVAASVNAVLLAAAPGPGAVAQNIVARAAAAASSQTSAVSIATLNGAGVGGATPADIAAGTITGGPIGAAGAVAKAVIQVAGVAGGFETSVGAAAITAATAASLANPEDAWADIAYNLANALKGAPAVANVRSGNVVTAMVGAIGGGGKYIPVIAALAGNLNQNAAAITAAGNAAAPGSLTEIADGGALVATLLLNGPYKPLLNYNATINAFSGPTTDDRNIALLYAASLANSSDAVGGLAAAIANTTTSTNTLIQAAVSANRLKQAGLALGGEVAAYAKVNAPTINVQAYFGERILSNPTLVSEIATAGAVVLPQWTHFIAHTVAFNAPQQAYLAAGDLVTHSKITLANPAGVGPNAFGVVGPKANFVNDRPAAVAAISAALATGIIESKGLNATDRKNALRDSVRDLVKALGSTYADYNDTGAPTFRRSDGAGSFTLVKAGGVAGAVTGFTAQLVKSGDLTVTADVTTALQAIAAAVGSGGFNYDIAQAAGQAFGWVSGAANAAAVAGAGQAAAQIAAAVFAGYGVGPTNTLAKIRAAVDWGLNEAAGGTGLPGAGAAGLRDLIANPAAPFYDHKSAQGRPVSNIFTL